MMRIKWNALAIEDFTTKIDNVDQHVYVDKNNGISYFIK